MMHLVIVAWEWLIVVTVKGNLLDTNAVFGQFVYLTVFWNPARLFSCGTNKDGESYMVEWNEADGYITRFYDGLCKHSVGVVQFSTSRNRFLVAGDQHLIKVWDMNNAQILAVVDADGGLPVRALFTFGV